MDGSTANSLLLMCFFRGRMYMWTHKPKNEPGMAMLSVIPRVLLVDFDLNSEL